MLFHAGISRRHVVRVLCGGREANAAVERSEPEDGVELFRVRLERAEDGAPGPERKSEYSLEFAHPLVDIHGSWDPGLGNSRGLNVAWGPMMRTRATFLAPVNCFYNLANRNRLTFACSDALNALAIRASVDEVAAELRCTVVLPAETARLHGGHEMTLRLDTRDVPYYEALRDVGCWWAAMPDYTPAAVPEAARLPMYSTWYGFHQRLTRAEVERQCALAKRLGCETVIVDHGWQTNGDAAGFSSCGDWDPDPERFPAMKEHVEAVHQLGMRYMLWFAVPYVGNRSAAWSRFAGMLLAEKPDTMVLDPRYPDVRRYLADVYERALREWGLDGFKLDFIDRFPAAAALQPGPDGPDFTSVPEATVRLLDDAIGRLRRIKPDVMIEFRQNYIGPLMRKYGTMLRAADCPNDAGTNRIRTLDIRLLCGATAAHADMVMWHPDDPVENAAMQLIHTLFAVPQISVLLDRLPPEHMEMVGHWLAFWREHRDALLDGELMPLYPHLFYPVVLAATGRKLVAAVYGDQVVRPPAVPHEWLIVNGTMDAGVVFELAESIGERQVQIGDCRGRTVRSELRSFGEGVHKLDIPPAGWAKLTPA